MTALGRRGQEMRSVPVLRFVLSLLVLLVLLFISSCAADTKFQCSSKSKCQALAGYVAPNATTYAAIKALFQVKSIRALFGANNLPASTRPFQAVPAKATVRVPFPCACSNGTGMSDRRPVYTVKKDDNLDAIARNIFLAFVTFQQIAAVNNILDPALIEPGQKFWIPLPCSCDAVDGLNVVHYAHLVAPGSSVSGIADEFGTEEPTLLRINGMTDPKALMAGQILDVPLRACNSSIQGTSHDSSLRIPNGSYALTAGDCVQCSCSSDTWRLHCQVTQGLKSSKWPVCPSANCSGVASPNGALPLGNMTVGTCEATTCDYVGFNDSAILTTLVTNQSTCTGGGSSSSSPSSAYSLRGSSSWTQLLLLLVGFHMVLLCSGFLY